MSSLSVAPSAKFGASNSTLKFLGIKKVLHAEEELWGGKPPAMNFNYTSL